MNDSSLDMRHLLIGRVGFCRLRDGRAGHVVIDAWFVDPLTGRTCIVARALENDNLPTGMLVFFNLLFAGTRAYFIGIPDEEEYEHVQGVWRSVIRMNERQERERRSAGLFH